MYSYNSKAEFLAVITPVFSVTWSFRNHYNADLVLTFIILINIENSCAT